MKVAYFDCFSGISGDMTLGALLACGEGATVSSPAVSSSNPLETILRNSLASLGVSGYNLHITRRKVEGLMATDVDVELTETDQGHGRHLSDITAIYANSDLPARVRENALAIFTRLAHAEARVHGTTIEEIHFHEVGAVDSIVDITGACILLDALGIDQVRSSPLPMSRGFIDCQHGRMPLPAPATMELLVGLPAYPVSVKGELVTPTGAAFVATLAGAKGIGEPPAMTPLAVGYGAGKKDWGAPFPNLLRVIIGETGEDAESMTTEATTVVVLETNVDDATPETLGYAQEKLLAQGALDVFFVAAQMKKNRPGVLVTVLAAPHQADALAETLLAETGTFGVRRTVAQRDVLDRGTETTQTPFGLVRVKVGSRAGRQIVAAPEYEDCRSVAQAAGVPIRAVYAAAFGAHAKMLNAGTQPPG